MTPIQQLMLGVGAKKKTFIDDVFSTFLYRGNDSTRSINNGIDLAGEGGMIWFKNRDDSADHDIYDSVRGITKRLESNTDNAQASENTTQDLTSFNSNGFSLGAAGWSQTNWPNKDITSWTFRKAPGFFDIVTYTGNGSARTISHSLACQPGRIIIKCTSKAGDWLVNDYAWDHNGNLWAKLNSDGQFLGAGTYTGSTAPTSTGFTLGSANEVNEDGETFVAYIFAGGDRTGNASVEFHGDKGYLKFKDSSDWLFQEQFCIEYWIYVTDNSSEFPTITWGSGAYRAIFWTGSAWKMEWPDNNGNITLNGSAPTNTWKHHVITKDSSNRIRFFIDGELIASGLKSDDQGANEAMYIGYKGNVPSLGFKNGKLSNVRIVNGSIPTTYQTSSTTNGASIFTSPTAPLTKTSQGASSGDVKLICCNDIGAAQASYINDSPGMSNNGVIGAEGSSDSPFSTTLDAGAVFGENEDKPLIRTGQYLGTGDAEKMHIDVGFEPQYLMIKRSGGSDSWLIFDSMRGMAAGTNDPFITAEANSAETTDTAYLELTSRGFKLNTAANSMNGNEEGYVYLAIRRPDGYVGKPAKLATDVFAMDSGNGSGTIPAFDSGFPVDFVVVRKPAAVDKFDAMARLMSGSTTSYVRLNQNTSEATGASNFTFDSNVGWAINNDSTLQSWMWKRHSGLDCVTYTGSGVSGRKITHGLGKTPEMIWVKCLNQSEDWTVGHKNQGARDGSSDHWRYYSVLHNNGAATWSYSRFGNNITPTSSQFEVSDGEETNESGDRYLAVLFASVNGICKVGSYTGTGSSGNEQTLGFTPRFLIIKNTLSSGSWQWTDSFSLDLDASGDEKYLDINQEANQYTGDYVNTTATGFTFTGAGSNASSTTYIYYAHA